MYARKKQTFCLYPRTVCLTKKRKIFILFADTLVRRFVPVKEKIIQLLDEDRIDDLQSLLETATAEDLAKILEELDTDRLTKLFGCLDKEVAADVFDLLVRDTKKRVLKAFTHVKLQEV